MRCLLLLGFVSGAALAQTRVDTAVTVGVGLVPATGEAGPYATTARLEPELSGWLGFDSHFAALGLTPGLLLRLVRPASRANALRVPLGGNNPPMASGNITVIRADNGFSTLPSTAVVMPIFGASATVRFEAFEPATVLFQLDYERDPNSGTFEEQAIIVRIRHTVSVQLLGQVRF